MQFTDLQLKQYLLGGLDEQIEEEIGLRIISDEMLEEKLLIAENDLIEDFLDENLSPEEVELFYQNYLICDSRKKQLEEVDFFKWYSRKKFQTEVPVEKEEYAESFWKKIQKSIGLKLRFAVPVLIVLIIAAFGFYFFYPANQSSPLEREFAELNRQDFADTEKFSGILNVGLISGTYRDSGAIRKLEAKNLSDKIFFRLALPSNIPETERLKAEVSRDGQTIFQLPETRVYHNRSGQEIRLLLPQTILTKGHYQIKIFDPQRQDSLIIYNFAVE